MKNLLLVLLLGVLTRAHAQEGAAQVRKAMEQQVQAWNKGDLEGFMQAYWKSDSMKFIGSKGINYGWQKTLDNYREHYPDKKAMGTLAFKLVEVSQLSDASVFVAGRWSLEKDRPTYGHFTLLWRKIDGRWVIVNDHSS